MPIHAILPPPTPTVEDRFWLKVDTSGVCWEWKGWADKHGYGRFGGGQRSKLTHRWAYEQVFGPIPSDLDIDHLCSNPPCVRYDHLEAVSRAENNRRAYGRRQTCRHGHLLNSLNTYVYPATGYAKCRVCRRGRESAPLSAEALVRRNHRGRNESTGRFVRSD